MLCKRFIASMVIGISVAMFSGCGAKVGPQISAQTASTYGTDADQVFRVSSLRPRSIFSNRNTIVNEGVSFLIQSDAETTLNNGYRYFRIIEPIDTSTEVISTPQEVHKLCFSETIFQNISRNSGVAPKKDCAYNINYAQQPYYNAIAVYKNKPTDTLVIDAQEMIDYLKKHDLYVEH